MLGKCKIKVWGKRTVSCRNFEAEQRNLPIDKIPEMGFSHHIGDFTGWGLDSDTDGPFSVGFFMVEGKIMKVLPENIEK